MSYFVSSEETKAGYKKEFHLIFVPRKSLLCEKKLKVKFIFFFVKKIGVCLCLFVFLLLAGMFQSNTNSCKFFFYKNLFLILGGLNAGMVTFCLCERGWDF